MKHPRTAYALPLMTALLGSLFLGFDAQAATAQERYRSERAACLNGSSSQDRATCLKEAGAALAEARKTGRQPQAEPDYRANALLRCDRQPEAERGACRQLVLGAGSSSGSVAGGAIVRELVTQSVGKPATAASAP
ncbi:MAG: hypothetical protein IV097_04080 [Burkholderiaceae bacterium]|nr:hypothetical protein [Burkholderiaceae bacterium]